MCRMSRKRHGQRLPLLPKMLTTFRQLSNPRFSVPGFRNERLVMIGLADVIRVCDIVPDALHKVLNVVSEPRVLAA